MHERGRLTRNISHVNGTAADDTYLCKSLLTFCCFSLAHLSGRSDAPDWTASICTIFCLGPVFLFSNSPGWSACLIKIDCWLLTGPQIRCTIITDSIVIWGDIWLDCLKVKVVRFRIVADEEVYLSNDQKCIIRSPIKDDNDGQSSDKHSKYGMRRIATDFAGSNKPFTEACKYLLID